MNEELKRVVRRFLPRLVRPHKIFSGPLRGATIITSWHDYPAAILGRTEHALLNNFAKEVGNGETWLDAGAHYGYTAIALSRLVGAGGRVFAFEPMVATAGCVCQARTMNKLAQLTVVPIALTKCTDVELDSLSTVRGMIDSTLDETAGLQVPFIKASLDWLWPRIAGHELRVDGVKIDVQGMEISVLEGMAETLSLHRPKLFLELHEGVSRDKILSLLQALGYSMPGTPVEPEAGETVPLYFDNRTYYFTSTDK